MRRFLGVVFIFALAGGIAGSGCDTGESIERELLFPLLDSSGNGQGIMSFSDGSSVRMTSVSGFGWTGGGYVGGFQKDLTNFVLVGFTCSQPMTAQTYTQASTGFSFGYVKNGTQYSSVGSPGFTFIVSSVYSGRASGTFSGTLVPVSGPNVVISSGRFTGIDIH